MIWDRCPHRAQASFSAAGKFEPSGSSFPGGLRVTWPLSTPRQPGEKLWIITLDEARHRWLWTGEMADVASSGMLASGKVYHFSSTGLSDQKPFGQDEGGSPAAHRGAGGRWRSWLLMSKCSMAAPPRLQWWNTTSGWKGAGKGWSAR